MDLISKAVFIAANGHAGQMDRQGHPYILHPLRVMHKVAGRILLRPPSDRWEVLAATVLHDVVEDTMYTLDGLRRNGLPEHTLNLVDLLTHIKDATYYEDRNESYRKYIERLEPNSDAKLIKLADLTDNLWHPARRDGWIGHEKGKARYLNAYYYLTTGKWPSVWPDGGEDANQSV